MDAVVYVVDDDMPKAGEHDRQLVVPLLRGGQPVADLPTLDQSRQRVRDGLVSLPWEGLKLSNGEPAIPTVYS